jgi:hypothetical protein
MNPFNKLDKIAQDQYGEFGFVTLDQLCMGELIDMNKADKIAQDQYGEFGFCCLDASDMETLINENITVIIIEFYGQQFNDTTSCSTTSINESLK